jgi:hypothetical protein
MSVILSIIAHTLDSDREATSIILNVSFSASNVTRSVKIGVGKEVLWCVGGDSGTTGGEGSM